MLQSSFAQHISRDSYTGSWESPASWNPVWPVPVRDSVTVDITINGHISTSASISFKNDPASLIINDTLVINGNLYLSNKNKIIINDGGILIVKGNISVSNRSEITANGYLVVTGNVLKSGSLLQGAALSNDVPEKVFVAGTVAPLLNNYPLFDTTVPAGERHPSSGYAYGNATDLANDPIYSFLMATCKRKITGSTPVCEGGNISLHAEGGASYSWTGPGGFTSNLQDPVINPAATASSGEYSVVIDGGGCSAETKKINITVNAPPIATISCPAGICEGSAINLSSTGGAAYSWTGPDGFSSNAQNPLIAAASTGMSGTYTVKVTSAENCSSTVSANLVVNPLPVITADYNNPVCIGGALQLTSSGGITFNWTGPDGFTSSAQSPIVMNAGANNAGPYKVVVTDANSCSAEKEIQVTVNSLPVPVIQPVDPVCTGGEIALLCSGGFSYSWSGPAGFASSLSAPSIKDADMSRAGTYEVTVTDQNNCSDKGTVQVTVRPLPVPVVPAASTVCTGETISLSCSGGVNYSWTGPSGFTSALPDPAITAADDSKAGTYEVTVTDQYNCSNKASVLVVVKPLPDVKISLVADHVCSGDNLVLGGNPDGGIFSLKNGPGNISGKTFSATGPGVIDLEYTYDNGCRNGASKSLVVVDRPVPDAGPDQSLDFVFESTMAAVCEPGMQGKWKVVSGTGKMEDEQSPVTKISGLSVGENIFRWTVSNGYCEESREMIIIVKDLVMPSVITPNNDGRNDRFTLPASIKSAAFTVFNRWGGVEFRSNNYQGEWDGRNAGGDELPEDTYFYILNSGNGIIRKGSITVIR